ncbi:hypothetical protein [Paenibacillus hexagrammi]|uniref:Uncharacterized protein n=1 Tax=Paenibacillus hexagrammi TaxID=2908839 RepID=A0ABY3SR41_9BACL|nr:hypothetical protein [Paenibacillus sp. YPD9-1]UJF35575.1 hypothetical protein L0M14_11020 [Paenibacillus sp. YPD9-1]
MNLLLGEAVLSDGSLASVERKDTDSDAPEIDMYVKPFSFRLPQEQSEVKTPLKQIPLGPYTMSLDHIGTSLNEDELSLKFNYEILKDTGTIMNADGRKIVFEINDSNGVRAIEWSADVNSFELQSGEDPETPQSELRVGKYSGFKISLENGDLLYKLSFLKTYDFNIYEEFQGFRRLVGTMKNDWFVVSD